MNNVLNIDSLLTKARVLAENINLLDSCKNFTQEESEKLEKDIKLLSAQLQEYVPDFKNPTCERCFNFAKCFKNREPSLRCFQVLNKIQWR